jgi:class 3 adenylate cyclase
MDATPGARGATAVGVERRLVSVLFADLVGFTARAESSDPEEVREFLTRYFDAATEIIKRYGGTVEKFIGDAVMAVWGTPTAFEDDAERAVRAALDLMEAVRALELGPSTAARSEVEEPVEARAAVMTGHAAVTVGAIGQGMVAGSVVNMSSRLQAAAAPGSVLVDESTHRIASRAVVFEQVGEQTLRGITTPVAAWRALRVRAEPDGLRRAEALEPPFVEREEELRLLQEQLRATGREGKARLVTILGEAGMGKSRLVDELRKYADGLAEPVHWHMGRSPAYGEGIAYWALGEMVRRRAGIAESESAETARPKLSAAIAEVVADESDRSWMEPRLSALIGLSEAPPGEREELFAAWRRFFEHMADEATTLLVFDDLHWADQSLLDYVESVLEWSRSRPILVIGLARTDLLDRRPTWGTGWRASVTLHLEPLTQLGVEVMLRGLAPGLPRASVEHIAERSEGVPLYAVETVRMLLVDGRLTRDGEPYGLKDPEAPIAVPTSLHALIAARLDALAPPDRSLVGDAAVLGKSFKLEALAAVSSRSMKQLEERLRQLIHKELVELDADPRSTERGQYRFVHELFREVAYATLSRRDRRERHLAAARYFEALGDDELAGVLASHYLDAYRAAPEDAQGQAVAAQARIALRAAADRALSLHAYAAALRYLEDLLGVTSDEREAAAIRVRIAEPAEVIDRPKALRNLGAALAWYQTHADLGASRATTVRLAQILIPGGELDEAQALLERATADISALDDGQVIAQLHNEVARVDCYLDRIDQALEACEAGLAVAERLGLEAEIAELLVTKSWAFDLQGRGLEAEALAARGLLFATRAGRLATELRARMNLSNIQMTDSPQRGFDTADGGVQLARRIGHERWASSLAGNMAACAILTGQPEHVLDTAEAIWHDGLLAERRDGLIGSAMVAEAMLGTSGPWADRWKATQPRLLQAEDWQARSYSSAIDAMAAFARCDASAAALAGMEQPGTVTSGESRIALVWAAEASLWLGDLPAARKIEAILALTPRGDTGAWIAACRLRLQGALAGAAGDRVTAVRQLKEAIERSRVLNVPLDLAITLADLWQVLGPAAPEASTLANEALAIVRRIPAPAHVERLERLFGGQSEPGVVDRQLADAGSNAARASAGSE